MNAVQRVIINKETNEIEKVTSTSLGQDTVEFTTEIGVFSFINNGNNQFENETYVVKEI